ncbi:NifU family protein [Aquidulcibacter paucihalophilus]|uniref:NifU family protein n=1 Tax=Aquidulcibacter paucihalophilus TaxID=1978549 RepID=UPI000A18D86C|nr:NifU family protein [Aquidulcibacter paucihalophilus]
MFIQTEATPNPATLKFLPGRDVHPAGAIEFNDVQAASASPLATALFKVEGVRRVFFGSDFITVTKSAEVDWPHIKPSLLGAIMDTFLTGLPIVTASVALEPVSSAGSYIGDAAQIVREIEELLTTRVRPAVAQDGGDIDFDRFEPETGTVYLRLRGSCAGCPSSTITLKQGIENMLKHYVPEVLRVEQAL